MPEAPDWLDGRGCLCQGQVRVRHGRKGQVVLSHQSLVGVGEIGLGEHGGVVDGEGVRRHRGVRGHAQFAEVERVALER